MLRKLIPLFFFSLLLSGCSLKFPSFTSSQKSGLQVTSTPQATVLLDGQSLGITPIQEEGIKSGTYTIKLVPSDNSLQPWETQITLVPGVLTVIDRKLAASLDQSHGYSLSFEKLQSSDQSRLAVTTIPDSVTVTVDGNPQGFTPVSLDTLTEGEHTILLTSPGFEDKTIRARTVAGYSLTISAQLAKKGSPDLLGLNTEASPSAFLATPSANLSPTPSSPPKPTTTPSLKPTTNLSPSPASTSSAIPKPYIEIDSSVGWANIRPEPNTNNTAFSQANNGERFPYLNQSTNGYYKIQYSPTQIGWVSSQYSTLVN